MPVIKENIMYSKWINLLAEATEGTTKKASPWGMWIIVGVFVLLFVGMSILNRRSQKKRQQETENTLNAIKPGNKVKTVGGICGIVVEVCPEDNTFVLETGTEASGKSYIKFDRQAIYQTDAVPEPVVEAPVEEAASAEEILPVEEAVVPVVAEEAQEKPAKKEKKAKKAKTEKAPVVEEAPVEAVVEEAPVVAEEAQEKPAKKEKKAKKAKTEKAPVAEEAPVETAAEETQE